MFQKIDRSIVRSFLFFRLGAVFQRLGEFVLEFRSFQEQLSHLRLDAQVSTVLPICVIGLPLGWGSCEFRQGLWRLAVVWVGQGFLNFHQSTIAVVVEGKLVWFQQGPQCQSIVVDGRDLPADSFDGVNGRFARTGNLQLEGGGEFILSIGQELDSVFDRGSRKHSGVQ